MVEKFSNEHSSILIAVNDKQYRDRLVQLFEKRNEFFIDIVEDANLAFSKIRDNDARKHTVVILQENGVLSNDKKLQFPLISEIRLYTPELPIIHFYGNNDNEQNFVAVKNGAFTTVTKGTKDEELAKNFDLLRKLDTDLWQVSASVCELLNTPLTLIWLLDKNRGRFNVEAWNGPLDDEYREKVKIDYYEIPIYDYLEKGVPLCLYDLRDKEKAPNYNHREFAINRNWKSLLSCPMIFQGEVIGIIDTYTFNEKLEFDNHQKRQIHTIAKQAGAIIHNRSLYKQSRLLSKINRDLAVTHDLEGSIDNVFKIILDQIGAQQGYIYSLERKSKKLVLRSCLGFLENSIDRSINLDDSIIGLVAELEDKNRIIQFLKEKDNFSAQTHYEPIIRNSVVKGVIAIQSHIGITKDDKKIASGFARRIGAALDRERLSRHMDKIKELSSADDIDKLLDYIVEAVYDLTGLATVLWRLNEREEGFKIQSLQGLENEYKEIGFTPLEGSITGEALKIGNIIWRRDIRDDMEKPLFKNMNAADEHGWHFFICVPLIGKEKNPLGSLSLYGMFPQDLHETQRSRLWEFANQIAIEIDEHIYRRQFEQLNHIGEHVSNKIVFGLKSVLQEVAKSAYELFDADVVAIYPFRPDDDTQFDDENIVVHSKERPAITPNQPGDRGLSTIIKDEEELFVHSVEEGEIEFSKRKNLDFQNVKVEKISQLIQEQYFIRRKGIRAFSGILIKKGNNGANRKTQYLGIMYIDLLYPHRFTRQEIRFIRLFTQHISIAIQNARLLETEKTLRNQAEALYELADELSRVISVKDSLKKIVTGAISLLKADGGIVHAIDPSTIEVYESYGFPDDFPHSKTRFSERIGLTWEIYKSKELIEIVDVNKDERPVSPDTVKSQIKSLIGIPLKITNSVIGVLFLDKYSSGGFTSEEKSILNMLAEQAAFVIERSRLNEAQIAAIHQISDSISQLSDINKVFENILDSMATLMPKTSLCEIRIFDKETDTLSSIVTRKAEIEDEDHISMPLGKGITGLAAYKKKTLYIPDVSEVKAYVRFIKGTRSEVASPMLSSVNKELLGVLNVEHPEINPFTQKDIELIEAIAKLTASVIERHRLEQENIELDELLSLSQNLSQIEAQ